MLERLIACAHKVIFAEKPMRVENGLLRLTKDMKFERGARWWWSRRTKEG